MGFPVFYASEQQIDTGRGRVTLSGVEARHLAKSLRARAGDEVTICDAQGTLHQTVIESPPGEAVTLRIASSRYVQPEKPQVVLLQAMPHLASMDLIVARAAESGASRVVPFVARRSPLEAVRKSSGRITRWQAIARESSKLSRRPWPLEVRTAVDGFIDKDLLVTVGCCLVFWEEESRALSNSLPDRPPRSLGIVIGPEGGFEPAEVDVLRSLGCRTASLGDLNITSEGAGSYAAMLVRYHYGLLCPEVPPGE